MSWLSRNDPCIHVERASPAKMVERFGGVFVDGNGNAISTPDWIFKPNLSAVSAFDKKYWIRQAFPDDTVTLMGQAARDAIDAAEVAARVAADRAAAKLRYEDRDIKALALVMLDEINLLRDEHGLVSRTPAQLKAAHDAKVDTL